MRDYKAANRYANALLQIAEELGKLDEVENDLKIIDNIVKSSRDFVLFLRSPIINTEKKKKVIISLFHDRLSELTYKFLLLLVTKNRESIIPSIIKSYWKLLDEKNGIINAELICVIQPTDEQLKNIIKRLEVITKRKIRMAIRIDNSLIGGFIIRIEDTIYDASVLNQFNILKKRFLTAPVSLKIKT